MHHGFRIGDVPVPVQYMEEASSIALGPSIRYGLGTVGTVAKYYAHRLGLRRDPVFRKGEAEG